MIKYILLTCALFQLSAGRPEGQVDRDVIAILRNDVISPSAQGEYSFDTETADGIIRSESGVGSGPSGAVESQGLISFTHPDGTPFELKFVANANGFQPESAALPIAPAFPHEIPQFVLDQIAFAQQEDQGRELDPARGDYVGYE